MGPKARTKDTPLSKRPEYTIWASMKQRCCNAKQRDFCRYGGRGITVCDRWRASFADFYADMGPRPSLEHSLDRINNDGNYEPGNVRWATSSEQAENTYRAQAKTTALAVLRPFQLQTRPPTDLRAHFEEALLALWNQLESEHSRRAYRTSWKAWCAWLTDRGIHPLAATPLQVQQYLAWMHDAKKAKGTRGRALTIIRSTYGALVVAFSGVDGILKSNPAREVKNIRVPSEPRTPWLNEDELRKLLTPPARYDPWFVRRDWLLCVTLFGTALRRAEVLRLHREVFQEAAEGAVVALVHVKGGRDRYVPIPRWVWAHIQAWCERNRIERGPIFPSFEGSTTPACPGTVRNAVKRTAARTGIDEAKATPHALRRSFVTVTGRRGASLDDRQYQLGHASQRTTELYDHADKRPASAPGELLGDLVSAI